MSHIYPNPASNCPSLVQPRLLLEFVARNRHSCTYESYDWLGYFGWQLLFSTCIAFLLFCGGSCDCSTVRLFAGVADVTNPSSVVNHLRLVPLVPISLEMIHFGISMKFNRLDSDLSFFEWERAKKCWVEKELPENSWMFVWVISIRFDWVKHEAENRIPSSSFEQIFGCLSLFCKVKGWLIAVLRLDFFVPNQFLCSAWPSQSSSQI